MALNDPPDPVVLIPNYDDSPGEGFWDSALGSARRAAFQFALDTWSSLLVANYPGETITLNGRMDPLGGSAQGAVLGEANPVAVRLLNKGLGNTWYGDALANHLFGGDLGTGPEIEAVFNSDLDNPTVLGPAGWYYGLDGKPGGSDVDFFSVVLHEAAHGLNFLDLINPDGSWSLDATPGIYDRFLETGNRTCLTAMTTAQRAAALVSGDLFWGGPQAVAANGGVRPKLFAPNPYVPGSSVSHLDETLYGGELMSPYYSGPDRPAISETPRRAFGLWDP